jgi:hypothetical protein
MEASKNSKRMRQELVSILDIGRAENISMKAIRYMHFALRKYHDKDAMVGNITEIFSEQGLSIGKAKADEYVAVIKHLMVKQWPRISP